MRPVQSLRVVGVPNNLLRLYLVKVRVSLKLAFVRFSGVSQERQSPYVHFYYEVGLRNM